MKVLNAIFKLAASGVILLTALWCYALGPFTSPWIEFGYYGEFNQVQRLIREMPDVRIVDHWQHHNLTMEDFGFTVWLTDGSASQVNFYENSPQMKLRRDDDIRKYLRKQISIENVENRISLDSVSFDSHKFFPRSSFVTSPTP